MLIGVGCDLIEIERVKKACEKEAFLLRIYTESERRQAKEIPGSLPALLPLKRRWRRYSELDSGSLCRSMWKFLGIRLESPM